LDPESNVALDAASWRFVLLWLFDDVEWGVIGEFLILNVEEIPDF
jgi:hypothetical protein